MCVGLQQLAAQGFVKDLRSLVAHEMGMMSLQGDIQHRNTRKLVTETN